jgi:hypothetical protein
MATLTKARNDLKFVWYPYADNVPTWAENMNQYSVRISRGEVSHDFDYFKGVGIVDGKGLPVPPTLWEVLETLISDWQTLESSLDFADWANNLGYNSDSIADSKIYDQVIKQSAKLLELISEQEAHELYEAFTSEI